MGTLGRKAREKEAERMSEESMIEHFPNLIKTWTYTPEKLNTHQIGKTQEIHT